MELYLSQEHYPLAVAHILRMAHVKMLFFSFFIFGKRNLIGLDHDWTRHRQKYFYKKAVLISSFANS